MKKSRIAKLALLGASTAALAATLTTSTYAWYVSNKTADVNAVAGSTASSGAGSSISLSTTGNINDFRKTITLDDKTYGLNPVDRTLATLGADGSVTAQYRQLDETGATATPKTAAETSASGYWYEYVFYIKADAACTVRPEITVTNTTSTALPTQINYSGGYQKVTGTSAPAWAEGTYYSESSGVYTLTAAEPANWSTTYTNYYTATANMVTGVQPGADFYVNAANALSMSLGIWKGTQFASGTVDNFVGTSGEGAIQNFASPVESSGQYMQIAALTSGQIPTGATLATGGAQNYYETISSKTLSEEAKSSYVTTNGFGNITLAQNTPYKLVYHLWLDGADDLCFNAAAGQTFSVAFNYVVTA